MTGKQLINVRPYHAADPATARVWHDRADCETGRWIPSTALRAGTGGLERCPECARLDARQPIDAAGRAGSAPAEIPIEHPLELRPTTRPTVEPQGRRRPRVTTAIGVAACSTLALLAILWQTGKLDPHHAATAAAAVASSTTSSTTTLKTAKPDAGAVASALQAFRAATSPSPQAADAAAPEPTTAGADSGGSYSVAPDGYTHGTESDGEPCSDNPDDPLFPCAHMIPGSDGIGGPLPGTADTNTGAGARAGAATRTGAADPAARAQRREARRLSRSSRAK